MTSKAFAALLLGITFLFPASLSAGRPAPPDGWDGKQCNNICSKASVVCFEKGKCEGKSAAAGDYDYLLLDLYHLPQFCRDLEQGADTTVTHPPGSQCWSGQWDMPQGLSIHGLWPNYWHGFPACCTPPPVPERPRSHKHQFSESSLHNGNHGGHFSASENDEAPISKVNKDVHVQPTHSWIQVPMDGGALSSAITSDLGNTFMATHSTDSLDVSSKARNAVEVPIDSENGKTSEVEDESRSLRRSENVFKAPQMFVNQPLCPEEAIENPELMDSLHNQWVDPIFPSTSQALCYMYNHEWQKHGYCASFEHPEDYLTVTMVIARRYQAAMQRIEDWTEMGRDIPWTALRDLFDKEPQILCSNVGSSAGKNLLSAINICFERADDPSLVSEVGSIDCPPASYSASSNLANCDRTKPVSLQPWRPNIFEALETL